MIARRPVRALHRRRARLVRRAPALDAVFTPKHASWLNQIERMFSILHQHVLERGSFTSQQDLQEKIYAYMHGYPTETDQPFGR